MNIGYLRIEQNITVGETDALLIVDIQNDFLPGGALAVEGGHQIIPKVNEIGTYFRQKDCFIALTQDWHPPSHKSFASNQPGKKPGDEYENEGIGPVLWPDHCVQGTKGADFHEDLDMGLGTAIIRKGVDPEVDSYSGFRDKKKMRETGLRGYFQSLNCRRIFICGLALDYCVFFSAMDAIEYGFQPYILIDMTRGINQPEGRIEEVLEEMTMAGVLFANLQSFRR